MNINILNKCLAELNTSEPDISYIRGMLETLIDMGSVNITSQWQKQPSIMEYTTITTSKSDEENAQDELARKYAGGPIAELS